MAFDFRYWILIFCCFFLRHGAWEVRVCTLVGGWLPGDGVNATLHSVLGQEVDEMDDVRTG